MRDRFERAAFFAFAAHQRRNISKAFGPTLGVIHLGEEIAERIFTGGEYVVSEALLFTEIALRIAPQFRSATGHDVDDFHELVLRAFGRSKLIQEKTEISPL